MNPKIRFLLLLALAFPLLASAAGTLDSLRQALAETKEVPEQLRLLIQLGTYYNMRNHDSTAVVCRSAIDLARGHQAYEREAQALLTLGLYLHKKSEYSQAKALYFQALAVSQAHNLGKEIPRIYNNLAVAYQREYQQDSSYLFLLKAKDAFETLGPVHEVWKTYYGLFEFFAAKSDTAQARYYAYLAYDVVKEAGNRIDHGYLLFQLRHHFFNTGQFDHFAFFEDQWEAYQRAKKTSQELMETPEHIDLFVYDQKDAKKVEAQLKQAISYFKEKSYKYRTGQSCQTLGAYYLKAGDQAAAEAAFRAALQEYDAGGTGYQRGQALYQLYLLKKGQGQATEALSYLENYRALSDSLSSREVEEHINEMKVAYETEQKEQALSIKTMELSQKTQQRNLLLAGIFALLALAAGILWNLRERLRTNRKLSEQEARLHEQRMVQLQQANRLATIKAMVEGEEKERLRIANDLHDSLGGLLTSAKAQLSGLPSENGRPKQASALLDHAAVELRRISHGLMPRALSLLGLKGALEDLAAQLRQDGLDCRLEVLGLDHEPDPAKAAMLFRIAQELVNNTLKHAQAKTVLMQLIQHGQELHFIMEDDGRGFILEQARRQPTLGLSSLASRVSYLNGELDIDTELGKGTTVTVRVPI